SGGVRRARAGPAGWPGAWGAGGPGAGGGGAGVGRGGGAAATGEPEASGVEASVEVGVVSVTEDALGSGGGVALATWSVGVTATRGTVCWAATRDSAGGASDGDPGTASPASPPLSTRRLPLVSWP